LIGWNDYLLLFIFQFFQDFRIIQEKNGNISLFFAFSHLINESGKTSESFLTWESRKNKWFKISSPKRQRGDYSPSLTFRAVFKTRHCINTMDKKFHNLFYANNL